MFFDRMYVFVRDKVRFAKEVVRAKKLIKVFSMNKIELIANRKIWIT